MSVHRGPWRPVVDDHEDSVYGLHDTPHLAAARCEDGRVDGREELALRIGDGRDAIAGFFSGLECRHVARVASRVHDIHARMPRVNLLCDGRRIARAVSRYQVRDRPTPRTARTLAPIGTAARHQNRSPGDE